MSSAVPVQRSQTNVMANAYAGHVMLAEQNYGKYLAQQAKVEAYEKDALMRQGGHKPLQGYSLRQDQAYKDLCGDRDRYQSLAQFHATMALLYK